MGFDSLGRVLLYFVLFWAALALVFGIAVGLWL